MLCAILSWLPAGTDGNLCVYDVSQTYLPIKALSATTPGVRNCAAISPDSKLLATVSKAPNKRSVRPV